MLKIAVLVSGSGTNLQALIDAEAAGQIQGGTLALVLSSRKDAYALKRAEEARIPAETILRGAFPDAGAYDEALLAILARYEIDLIVLAGFMTMISPQIVSVYRNRIINIHPALLPAFCGKGYYGLHVHEAALQRGVRLTGATVHFVNEICDGGPIILQKAVPVLPDDTPQSLQRRVMEEAEWQLLPQAVSLFCAGRLQVIDYKVWIQEEPN